MASPSSSSKTPPPPRVYLSNGHMLQSPPLKARVTNFLSGSYTFFSLYFTTLLSLDPYAAAQGFRNGQGIGDNRFGGAGGAGGGGGSGGGAGGGGGKRLGSVDDIRGPECKSCG